MLDKLVKLSLLLFLYLPGIQAQQQVTSNWHYRPQNSDFVKVNGKQRFNRALYGTNTAFRVEAGDLPEFALYLPGMGGCLRLGIMYNNESKWLINAQDITTTYRPGSMLYHIKDVLLGKGSLSLTVVPADDREGLLIRLNASQIPQGVTLCWAYGGATGKKFLRDGDIGADPESSFYLQPAYCKDNKITVSLNTAAIRFGKEQLLEAAFPLRATLKQADATQQETPSAFLKTEPGTAPALAGTLTLVPGQNEYFFIGKPEPQPTPYHKLESAFLKAEQSRKKLADRIMVNTPDEYINTLGGALSMAADGIWESPTFLHGAVAWRMRLNAWRGAYVADPLGWHDRARAHFSSYALSQLTSPETGPIVPDTALNFARQQEKLGTSMFSSGYICRNPNGEFKPHHYDMNLVFVDQLLRHFSWTGDTAYVKKSWPLLQRHLAWEKRNFDTNNDGLYDAYCCIWASDALQYSGGAVTHSTAYNYFANREAARLAELIGEDARPYQQEADKIYAAIQNTLWMPGKGWYAEYKDALGNQLLHPAAALWTIYHAIDSRVPDAFQAYQSLRYIDTHIPHIPVKINGETSEAYYLLSTSNWQPYTWSLNNVALAENLHTALAYWQGNRSNEAFRLWKSALVESMYMSASPGGFQQLSRYDAARGELYRDFADPIGMAARTLIEGLFGIVPDALRDTLAIHPGFPAHWKHAALQTPDVKCSFRRTAGTDDYTITAAFSKTLHLKLTLNAPATQVQQVMINGKPVQWQQLVQVGGPAIRLTAPAATSWHIVIRWKGNAPEKPAYDTVGILQQKFACHTTDAAILEVFDPQQVLQTPQLQPNRLQALPTGGQDQRTFFLLLKQGDLKWWHPVDLSIRNPVDIVAAKQQPANALTFSIKNNTSTTLQGTLQVNAGSKLYAQKLSIPANDKGIAIRVPAASLVPGTNSIQWLGTDGARFDTTLVNWNITTTQTSTTVNLSQLFNDKLTNIFNNQYRSPRPQSPTLQLPLQGIGNWCYPLVNVNINDSGFRAAAAGANTFKIPQGIVFATPADNNLDNIIYTSQWDNYPHAVTIPLNGRNSHLYLLLAGSTNAMQSQLENGCITVYYKDGSLTKLSLKNPDNWCPIEQDYEDNGAAFNLQLPRPPRISLKTGQVFAGFPQHTTVKGYTTRAIDGGAATILDMPLDINKELDRLELKTVANDVVIGLMAVSLIP
ncbi:DUF4450 domain-containing protein [Filimonas effusa]|uniref:DUF4450 domain-containing protein n=1 Tax=Filimonas effusa TaxID=2508721 RepID=A0A4Q1DAY0_9BACT|nr:DUF4450 domain-containing protein [Filimonas effusa]RXK86594.1 DUF4450 domain-containing protein [Filimonas effusa]